MKLVVPNYFKEFKCIANKCKDCCCIGWEIDVDEKTAEYYKSLNTSFGKEICNNIAFGETNHFILNTKNRCHFLNNKNLCNVILNIGEENLCKICAEHPRYYEWFDNKKEGGIGICCEEACRIILSQTKPFYVEEKEINFEGSDEYNSTIYDILHYARKQIINLLNNTSYQLSFKLKTILQYTQELQNLINDDLLDDAKKLRFNDFMLQPTNHNIINHFSSSIDTTYYSNDLKEILQFYTNLEILDEKWLKFLKDSITVYNEYPAKITNFKQAHLEIDQYLNNLAIYFIWRYFLKGCFDEEIISKISFMISSIAIIEYLYFFIWHTNKNITFAECMLIAKQYSKEIEYSDSNMSELLDSYYFNNEFKIEKLLAICNLI